MQCYDYVVYLYFCNSSYEDLMMDEKNLTSEIENFSKKFDSWSTRLAPKCVDAVSGKNGIDNQKQTEKMVPKEVEAFEVNIIWHFVLSMCIKWKPIFIKQFYF